jgi:hypothetical protein
MIHTIRTACTGINDSREERITLPDVPGVTLDGDRTDTAPRLPMIRRPIGQAHGAALRAKAQPRIAAFIEAIREARDEMGANE